jgi:hypothetical protein
MNIVKVTQLLNDLFKELGVMTFSEMCQSLGHLKPDEIKAVDEELSMLTAESFRQMGERIHEVAHDPEKVKEILNKRKVI